MEERSITLAWKDLCIYVPLSQKYFFYSSQERYYKFQRIVQNVTGAAYPGDLIAILGPPGPWKSIFLQVLGSRASSDVSVTGNIIANGLDVSEFMHKISGYVDADVKFFDSITVNEHLVIQAKLRMDKRLETYERKRRIQQLMEDFDLNNIRNVQIKNLSKEQQIRLSIIAEILNDPPILFCDNPAKGLDAAKCAQLVETMRNISNSGKIVISSFDQTPASVLDMFDQVWLLAEGHLAFMGTSRGAVNFFDSLNFVCPKYFSIADFFVHTLAIHPSREQECRQQIREICSCYNNSYFAKDLAYRVDLEMERDEHSRDFHALMRIFKNQSWITKTSTLLQRVMIDQYRTLNRLMLRFIYIIVTGIVVGLCFFGTETRTQDGIRSTKGILFILVNEVTFRSLLTTAIHLQTDELPIFIAETKASLYNANSYILAKAISHLSLAAIETLLLVATSYCIAGLNPSATIFFYTYLILFLTCITSTSFAFAFWTYFSKESMLHVALNPIHIFLMVTCGAFISICSISPKISWIRYISWMHYSYESLAVLHFENAHNIWCYPDKSLPCYRSGAQFLAESGIFIDNFIFDILLLILLYVCFNLVALIVLTIRSLKS